jgi:ABC-type glycerol-3-phosphate transport system substrate-binding protein
LLKTLSADVQAGTAPDAFFGDINVRLFQSEGVLEDTDTLTREAIQQHGATYPGYEDSTIFGSKWWGVPFYGHAAGMYVRRDIFARHGLDIERDTETYERLRESAFQVSDPANNLWGWGTTISGPPEGSFNAQQTLLRFGSQLQDQSGQQITFYSPETITGLRWLQETYGDQKWAKMRPSDLLSWNSISNNDAFLAGTTAITDNAGFLYTKAILDRVPHSQEIALLPRPVRNSDGQRLDALAGIRLHLIKGTRNRVAAADLFRHLLSEPVQRTLLQISPGSILPP